MGRGSGGGRVRYVILVRKKNLVTLMNWDNDSVNALFGFID